MADRNSNKVFYKSVRLKMKWKDRTQLRMFHKGLEFNIYDPVVDGVNLLTIPGYNTKKIDWVDITITAKSKNPNPIHENNERDIDAELAIIDKKWRILQDHIKPKDNDRLLETKQPRDTLIKHGLPILHPYLQGENDVLIDKMEDKHPIKIKMSEIKEAEQYFEKRKALYHKTKLHYVSKLNEQTGEKYVETEMGYI